MQVDSEFKKYERMTFDKLLSVFDSLWIPRFTIFVDAKAVLFRDNDSVNNGLNKSEFKSCQVFL